MTREVALQAIECRGGNVHRAARDLGVTHSYLQRRIRQLKLQSAVASIRDRWDRFFRLT